MRAATDSSPSDLPSETRETVMDTVALAAALLFAHGQSTERIVKATERLGFALGVPVRVLLQWGAGNGRDRSHTLFGTCPGRAARR